MVAIDKDVEKLSKVGFITKTKYPTCLTNVVLVRNANNKWRMYVDFTDLNVVLSSGYHVLSFMNAYSRYNQIEMDPMDALKTTFMSYHENCYYNVIPFSLKKMALHISNSWTRSSTTRMEKILRYMSMR